MKRLSLIEKPNCLRVAENITPNLRGKLHLTHILHLALKALRANPLGL
jgi:hypothetical protein